MIPFEMSSINWSKSKGLILAVVQSCSDKSVLMVGYMNQESLQKTLDTGLTTFYSRSRSCLWTKGETSGNYLPVQSIAVDCDGDALLILVKPNGPSCHQGGFSCFSACQSFDFLAKLEAIIDQRIQSAQSMSSYVAQLSHSGIRQIARKVGEEALELILALISHDRKNIIEESADLLFHFLVGLRHQGIHLSQVVEVLNQRNKEKK